MNNQKMTHKKIQRQLFDVSKYGLKCAICGAKIEELPFQPVAGYIYFCDACNEKRKQK